MRFGRFLIAVAKHWWALMSCAIFTGIGIYAAWANKTNEWAIRASFTAAALCIFIACYLAWRDQHNELLESEQMVQDLRKKYENEQPRLGLNVQSTEGPKSWTQSLHPVKFSLKHLSGRVPTNIRFDPIPSKLGKFYIQFTPLAFAKTPNNETLSFEIVEKGAHTFNAADWEKLLSIDKEMLELFLHDCQSFTGDLNFPVVVHFDDLSAAEEQLFCLTFETNKYRFSQDTSSKPRCKP
jgi:hypothetical protein